MLSTSFFQRVTWVPSCIFLTWYSHRPIWYLSHDLLDGDCMHIVNIVFKNYKTEVTKIQSVIKTDLKSAETDTPQIYVGSQVANWRCYKFDRFLFISNINLKIKISTAWISTMLNLVAEKSYLFKGFFTLYSP